MPARRSTSLDGALCGVIAALALAAGCDRRVGPGELTARARSTASASASTPAPAPLPGAVATLAIDAMKSAAISAEELGRALPRGDAVSAIASYRQLRRRVARAAPFVRAVHPASEPLFGPPRGADEAGGALGALDRALLRRDPREAARWVGQISLALTLARAEIERSGFPPDEAARQLSTAAYDLGALLLSASADLPDDPATLLEVWRGTLDAIVEGATALGRDLGAGEDAARAVITAAAPIGAAIGGAAIAGAFDVPDRGALAVATGPLGAALRALAARRGHAVRPPYPPRVPARGGGPDEPISILTLPAPRRTTTSVEERAALARAGQRLFFDKRLSRGGVRSCASCHDPSRWLTDGLVTPGSLDPSDGSLRHTPTLLYTSLHAAQLWDGSVLTAESQALHVIHRRAEMGLGEGEIEAALSGAPEYRGTLGDPPSPARVAAALVAFEVEAMAPGDAPIDRYARGDRAALTADQRRGLDVFAGKGRCARCHVPPLFGGSRPPDFAVPVFAVLGVPASPTARALDPDRGRARVTRRAADEHAFKTPTVRDVAKTAPYFHHGRYPRLEEVVSFYDKGGGRGLGIEVPNQDPDVRPLALTADETRVLLVFVREALLDGTPPDRRVAPARRAPGEPP